MMVGTVLICGGTLMAVLDGGLVETYSIVRTAPLAEETIYGRDGQLRVVPLVPRLVGRVGPLLTLRPQALRQGI